MKKKKTNSLNRNSSIIVKFYPIADQEINEFLESLNISGVRVSNLISRWAIDVPYWKEHHYANKLMESDLVEKVYLNPSKKNHSYSEEEGQNDY